MWPGLNLVTVAVLVSLVRVKEWDSSSAWGVGDSHSLHAGCGVPIPPAPLPQCSLPGGRALRPPAGPPSSRAPVGPLEPPTAPPGPPSAPDLVIVAELIVQDVSVGLVRLRPGHGDAVGGATHLVHGRDCRGNWRGGDVSGVSRGWRAGVGHGGGSKEETGSSGAAEAHLRGWCLH